MLFTGEGRDTCDEDCVWFVVAEGTDELFAKPVAVEGGNDCCGAETTVADDEVVVAVRRGGDILCGINSPPFSAASFFAYNHIDECHKNIGAIKQENKLFGQKERK